MLIGEEPEVKPPPVPAIMMPIHEAIVRTPQQRRRYILKQDVARYGPTPECEACATLAAGAQRLTKPLSDECRARMEELKQCVEETLVQQRLHTDSEEARQLSKRAKMSEEIQTLKWLDRVYRRGAAEKHLVAKAHENPREQKQRLRGVVEKPFSLGQENPCKRRQKMPKQDEV